MPSVLPPPRSQHQELRKWERPSPTALMDRLAQLSPGVIYSNKCKKISTIPLNVVQILYGMIPIPCSEISHLITAWNAPETIPGMLTTIKPRSLKLHLLQGYSATGQYILHSYSTLALLMNIPRKQGHLYHQGQKVGQFPQEDVVILIFFIACYSYYYFIIFKRII